ncbi:MAG: sigma-70 family RNA polymerase sigma factor [Oscillatoria sp. SIO1A7]|nr:sigma-70 family RNA polymerase sigma factor [Oscillatoria sp. SIO1A7]
MANACSQEFGSSSDIDLVAEFWQQWQKLEGQLYKCCLGILKNPTEAEDALSRAMLKGREKIEKYAGKITKLGPWLRQLTRNLCFDIIKEKSRGAAGVEDIEWAGGTEVVATAGLVETPEQALEKEERRIEILRAIADLPQATRDTFVLHFYQQLSHEEIVQQQGISYQSVCKRISRARKMLKEKLKGYFRDGDVGVTSPEPAPKAKKLKQPKQHKFEESSQQEKAQEIPTPERIVESREIERESREEVTLPETIEEKECSTGNGRRKLVGEHFNFASSRLTPIGASPASQAAGAATQTKPKRATNCKSEMLPLVVSVVSSERQELSFPLPRSPEIEQESREKVALPKTTEEKEGNFSLLQLFVPAICPLFPVPRPTDPDKQNRERALNKIARDPGNIWEKSGLGIAIARERPVDKRLFPRDRCRGECA